MSVSETFDRKFNKSMRGYNTEEVDAALDALLRYCDELEDANREFEIANNDLIDDKTDLNKHIDSLNSQISSLEQKNTEMSERVSHVEQLYNNYRDKFGEARDMITKAKSASAEIITRAQAKAELIAEESAKKQEKALAELDIEIEKRRVLIENLEISYNRFNEELKEELQAMLGRVDSFSVMPILPSDIPEKRIKLNASDAVFIDIDDDIDSAPIDYAADVMPQEDDDEIEVISDPVMTPYDPGETGDEEDTDDESNPLLSLNDENNSRISGMISSIDEINKKVQKKKSTPYI